MTRKKNNFEIIDEKEPFLFIDGNTVYCSNGRSLVITKKDRQEAKKRKVTYDQLKILSYQYLSKKVDIEDYLEYLKTLEEN